MYPHGDYDKKALNMLILDILKEYTDKDHRLKQEEIIDLLLKHYGVTCDRRSIKSNILSLQRLDYPIPLKQGYCLTKRKFEAKDLRQLIESIHFSPTLSRTQVARLVERILSLGNRYFKPRVKHIAAIPEAPAIDSQEIWDNLDVLGEAIERKSKVSFTYNEYGTDLKRHPCREEPYVVSPGRIAVTGGRYYLVGSEDGTEKIVAYRVDWMTDVMMTGERAKPVRPPATIRNDVFLPRRWVEHSPVLDAASVEIKFRTRPDMMNRLVDEFGKALRVEEDGDEIVVTVSANEGAMFRWAMEYGDKIEILEPESLRERMRKAAERMTQVYGQEDENDKQASEMQ